MLPTIDLHGVDGMTARYETKKFISENVILKNSKIVIVHGKGAGIVKSNVHKELSENKEVLDYKLDNFNIGITIVRLKVKKL